jgi:NAD(P)-dependent dehydrogenase (short-subunit alcohol dehydrogenase family)
MEAGAMHGPLDGKVALVTGATRGAGRGIATELALAGAHVVATGRSTRTAGPSEMGRPETLDETVEGIVAAGGHATMRAVDHRDPGQVADLMAWIEWELGRLDVLVNDVWGGDGLIGWGVPFWEHDLEAGLRAVRTAVETHVITSWHAAPLLIRTGRGLVVEVTDGVTPDYRGNLFYDLAKSAVVRLAVAQGAELGGAGITAVAVSPGFLRSEAMLDHFGVTESDWRAAAAIDPHFLASETPRYVGRGVAALAADPDVHRFNGRALGSWELSDVYGLTDVDGSRPHWARYYARITAPHDEPGEAGEAAAA